jgi:CheY-like chemotaxis protein
MFAGLSFVYVEDDLLSREVMQLMMESAMGVTDLTLFENSADLLARLDALDHTPDIILLDIYVRPHNGFDMLKMLRKTPRYNATRIIALTASVMNDEVEQLRIAGFDGAIAKPLSVTTFPSLIERIARGESVWHVT